MRPFKDWDKKEWSGAATVLILFFGIPLLTWLFPRHRAAPPAPPASEDGYQPQRRTLTGTLECLPPAPGADPSEPCPLGLRAEDGQRYAVDFALMSSVPEAFEIGDRVTGSGVFVPLERLSTDRWKDSGIVGIFSVTDSFRVLPP